MLKKLTNIALAGTLALGLTGCNKQTSEVIANPIRPGETVIENALYKSTLVDMNGDGRNNSLKIERKFPTSYGSREPRVRYFVTSVSQSGTGILQGVEVTIVKPEFFDQYNNLFKPNLNSNTPSPENR